MAWRYIITTWASLPMMSLRVVPNSLCRKLDRRFTFDWLTSYLNCKLALNCASSPRRFSSQDLQEGNCHFLSEWQENQIIISFWNGWHITRGTQPKKCVMLGFSLMQLVTPNLEPVLFPRHNWCNHYLDCSMLQLNGIALPMCTHLWPSAFLPLITIWPCSWAFAEVPPCPVMPWMRELILMHPPVFLLADCVLSIAGRALKLTSEVSTIGRCSPLWPGHHIYFCGLSAEG
jgi:hypothetical protein